VTDPAPEEAGYELVMPFVVCASQGGPYEDQAFVAGYRLGLLSAELEEAEGHEDSEVFPLPVAAVRPADLPQVDLLAMRYGFTTRAEPWPDAPQEWYTVRFEPAGAVTP
jgi:hypothetical protein